MDGKSDIIYFRYKYCGVCKRVSYNLEFKLNFRLYLERCGFFFFNGVFGLILYLEVVCNIYTCVI